MRIHRRIVVIACAALALAWPGATPAAAADNAASSAPDFGPNVIVFNPSMPQAQIQATLSSMVSEVIKNFGSALQTVARG